jgi:isopentenyl-diphosphate delta-isomerase
MILIPAWDETGALRPMEKLDVHRRGLRHPAISVFVMRGRQTLLQRRAEGKYHCPGLWANAACTHPHWNESAEDAAKRRLREELGLTGLALRHSAAVEYRADVGGGLIEHEVVDVFLADLLSGDEARPNREEVSDLRWHGLADLVLDVADRPMRYAPWLRLYLRDHFSAIFGAATGR